MDADISATQVAPKTLIGRYKFRRADAARFSQLEMGLRENLRRAVVDVADAAAITGDGTGENLAGLFAAVDPPAAPGAAVANYAALRDAPLATIDGYFAAMTSDVRLAVSPRTYALGERVYRTDESEESVGAFLERKLGRYVSTAHLPEVGNIGQAVMTLTGGPAGRGFWKLPMWGSGVQLVRDEATGAAAGEIALTFVLLCASAVVRPAQVKRAAFRVAAGG